MKKEPREWKSHWDERAAIANPVEVNGYCRNGKPYSDAEYFQTVVAPLIERLEIEPSSRVLDVGCGTGTLLTEVEKLCAHSTGTDISPAMAARYKGRSKVFACEANNLPFDSGSFDRIVMNSVVHMFPSKKYFVEVVRSCLDILSPPGILLIGDALVGRDLHTVKPTTWKQSIRFRLFPPHDYIIYPAGWMAEFLNSLDMPWSIMAQKSDKRKLNRRFDIAIYKDQ